MEKEVARIIHELVASGFTREAKEKAIHDAEAINADANTIALIRNVVPVADVNTNGIH